MRHAFLLVLIPALRSSTSAAAQPYVETQTLTASDTAGDDLFGWSVAVSANTALIGAPLADSDSGAVYVFERDALTGAWLETQKLIQPGGGRFMGFANDISISGNVALVGAIGAAEDAGAAYVFERDLQTGVWSATQELTASDGGSGDLFGLSVSVSGNLCLIGSLDDEGTERGAVYAFERGALTGEWVEVQKLTPSDGGEGDHFGYAVSVSGGLAVIGAPYHVGPHYGAAYVFERDAQTGMWAQTQRLNADAAWYLGYSVSVSGPVALVGSWADNGAGPNSGSAHVFERDTLTGVWADPQKLVASDAAPEAQFGNAVSVSGHVALIGSRNAAKTGAAYVFERDADAGVWIETQKLTARNAVAGDRLGYSVSISTSVAFAGDPYRVATSGIPGEAYVFARRAPTGTLPDGSPAPFVGPVTPNPAEGRAAIPLSLVAPSAVTVAIYDALGRRVAVAHEGMLGAGAHRVAVPVHGLAPGVYVVRVEGPALKGTQRLTVVR